MSNSQEKIYSLRPSWQGKHDWNRGLPNAVKLLKQENKTKSNDYDRDYWGEYVSPVWDDMYEYRKSFLNATNYDDYYHHHISQNKEQTHEHQFITFSRNKKKKKNYSRGLYFKSTLDNIDAEPDIYDVEYALDDDEEIEKVFEDLDNDILDELPMDEPPPDDIQDNDMNDRNAKNAKTDKYDANIF
jgi:hypothetical protein